MPGSQPTPTVLTAADHDHAYDFFNAALFSTSLPRCLITISSRRRSVGYFRPSYFTDSTSGEQRGHLDEIGMNPEYYADLRDYLSTLVHEMVHLEQANFGKPGKGAHHNRAWAGRMVDLGLPPFNIRHPEKMIGERIDHTIQEGGPFDLAYQELLKGGYTVRWIPLPDPALEAAELPSEEERDAQIRKKRKKASKTPYDFPGCDLRAWAKPGARLMCADCQQLLIAKDQQDASFEDLQSPARATGTLFC